MSMDILPSRESNFEKQNEKLFRQWFQFADADGDGRITGDDAVKIFSLSLLSRQELKQVWAVADSKRQGFLGFKEFVTAMQIISLAQKGTEVTADILKNTEVENISPPAMEGLDELLSRRRSSPLKLAAESNGSSNQLQAESAQWFTSKSTKKSGPDDRSVPGNTIAVQADMPFSGLTRFGTAFLSKFECSQMPHPLLEHITFVDTPGVLSGEKQRTQRSYDFTGVTSWFAAKCDLILLLFDPYKLDISDEFRRVIGSLRGHDDKIRVVLNKADQVDTQQLMRVYGALMWSLGKVLNTPEVMRVYIGSFNDKPINEGATGPIGKELFEKEQEDLLTDLKDIPRKACDRRINEFVKRARAATIHSYIISHLKKEMPAMMGKAKAQQRLIDNLADEFAKVQREYHLPAGDFPSVEHFKEVLAGYNIDKFEKLKPKMVQSVDNMLGYDIPELLQRFRNPYD
ncbi:EH domain-containing protein 1 isoform X2 [Cryptomeria japonica]|uniref:EH domain-containing protein 1 isoform X2 n=1 Tax=Cryptomeria japonica TaxID=3369 RepID=UPI0025AD82F9|nr:EH domain-containing protein 1 isoform X2 [Cryptomeria japonica]